MYHVTACDHKGLSVLITIIYLREIQATHFSESILAPFIKSLCRISTLIENHCALSLPRCHGISLMVRGGACNPPNIITHTYVDVSTICINALQID
jgi:hypothetical protein